VIRRLDQCGRFPGRRKLCLAIGLALATTTAATAQLPNPALNTVFPPGGQVGQTVDVTIAGDALEELETLQCSDQRIRFQPVGPNQFRATIPADVMPGAYDLWAVGRNGVSSQRTFVLGNRSELLEAEPNETPDSAQSIPLDVVVNGRIEKGGDQDQFRFSAKQGQRVVIECRAERIDSRLSAVLELYDNNGRRIAVNRGSAGIDPMIDFRVPADGDYVVKLFDLVFSGSGEHYYRLEVDTGPRVAFAVPCVVQRGKPARVTLYGWNLPQKGDAFDSAQVDVQPPSEPLLAPMPVRLRAEQVTVDAFAYHYPGGHASVSIGVTDVPVIAEQQVSHSVDSAQEISFPCEVSGQLLAGDEQDWYAVQAERGDVIWIEAFGARIGSPVDLDVSLLDSSGENELARFSDDVQNVGGKRFPSNHLDPAGRWVVHEDGRYLIMIRNLIGGLEDDPRRVYRLSLRREEPDFDLAVVPRSEAPLSLNVSKGGRSIVDVLAFRRRGLTGAIRITATDLPAGVECPDIWLGPGVNSAPLTITADAKAANLVSTLNVEGHAESVGRRTARGGTTVRGGTANGWGRLTATIPLALRGESSLRIVADGHETRPHHLYGDMNVRHSPGGMFDVAVHLERRDTGHNPPVELIGVGVPASIKNQTATIPAGSNKGYLSFYLPPTLPVGRYTWAVKAVTTVPGATNKETGQTEANQVTVFSNPVTVDVRPAAFVVDVDPYAPKTIRRGEIVKVNYVARRINGFISKIHTELMAPDEVVGIRGRGVTFVGQTDSGTIQIVANDNAPLGQQPFLRLYAVGVVEDQPVYHGSCFLDLEIVE